MVLVSIFGDNSAIRFGKEEVQTKGAWEWVAANPDTDAIRYILSGLDAQATVTVSCSPTIPHLATITNVTVWGSNGAKTFSFNKYGVTDSSLTVISSGNLNTPTVHTELVDREKFYYQIAVGMVSGEKIYCAQITYQRDQHKNA